MARYCTYCGGMLNPEERFCTNCGAQVPMQEPAQTYPHSSDPQQPYYGTPMGYPAEPDMPMKWYKFVIYFQLFAACVLNGINGLLALSGGQYEGMADRVYMLFPTLQIYDVIYGVALMAFAVFALVIRGRLKKFCSDGPKLYIAFLIAGIVIPILYAIAASTVLPIAEELLYGQFISNIFGNIILLVCNIIYFNKRSHLFVNS